MSVLVIGQNGRPLMPTTTRKARILLKENKASVVCRHPFTIHLWYKTGCATQEGSVGIDTGSQHIGVGVTCGDKVILKDEHELRSSMEKTVPCGDKGNDAAWTQIPEGAVPEAEVETSYKTDVFRKDEPERPALEKSKNNHTVTKTKRMVATITAVKV